MPDAFPVHFRGEVVDFLRYTGPECIVSGPADCTKTFAMCWKVHLSCMNVPNFPGLLVRAKREDLKDSVIPTLQEIIKMCPTCNEYPDTVREYGKSSPYLWQYYNGSTIRLRGMDEHTRKQALGGQFGMIAVSQTEQISQASWETLTSRSTGRGVQATHTQVIGDANPSGPRHWILGRDKRQGGPLAHFVARHVDNPMMYGEDGLETAEGAKRLTPLRNLTGVTRARLLDGQWRGEEGMIYDAWDQMAHVVDELPSGVGKERFISVDWGYTNPCSIIWGAIDGDARLYIVRQVYHTDLTALDVSKLIVKYTRPDEGIITIICDHDAAQSAILEQELGIETRPAMKAAGSVLGGIGMVRDRLRLKEDGLPRLFILRDSLVEEDEALANSSRPRSMEDEFAAYVWATNPDGAPEDRPKKANDHSMDALRYLIYTLDADVGTYTSVL